MLFVGDDWANDHDDVELQDATGKRLTRARLPEGITGIARPHQLITEHLPADDEPQQVVIGIETDRGPSVASRWRHALMLFTAVLSLLANLRPWLRSDGIRTKLVGVAALAYSGMRAVLTWQAQGVGSRSSTRIRPRRSPFRPSFCWPRPEQPR